MRKAFDCSMARLSRRRCGSVRVVGLALTLICGACQSSTARPVASVSTTSPPSTPTGVTETTAAGHGDHTAEDAALADGVVTRAEVESLYLGYIDCLSIAGVRGKVAFDLDVSPQLNSSLYLPDDTDPAGTRLKSKVGPCDDSIAAAASAYSLSRRYRMARSGRPPRTSW